MIDKIKGGLIVSCQALSDEPLHSSFIMGRMAKAAEQGGAIGIRANTTVDIEEIAKNTTLPIIGLVKKDYQDSPIYITPTIEEIAELAQSPCSIIAFDATDRHRPFGQELGEFISQIRKIAPGKLLMADIATVDEAKIAESLGVDCVSTTMNGYTESTKGKRVEDDDFKILKEMLKAIEIPIVAEGQIDTPDKARRCLEIGVHAVVVGAAITRPQLITKAFCDRIKQVKYRTD